MPYIKAIVGALVAGLTSLGTALTDGTVTASEWVSVALSFLLGLGFVYAAPKNTGDELGEDGAASVPGFVWVLLGLALVLWILSAIGHPVHIG